MSHVTALVGISTLALVGVFAGMGAERIVGADPTPVVIHSLEYADGVVVQDRTITPPDGAQAFYAFWAASVMDADTGNPVDQCQGSGSWPYGAGRKDIPMSLARWTGNPDCRPEVLPSRFYLQATWFWGADQTQQKSNVYYKEPS